MSVRTPYQHTPGRWRTRDCNDGKSAVIIRGRGKSEESIQVFPAADAYLMAKAPQMYDALREILIAYEGCFSNGRWGPIDPEIRVARELLTELHQEAGQLKEE